MKEKKSLTSGIYHLNYALLYFEDFYRDCKLPAKRQSGNWVTKLRYVINDVFCALTPESRDRFRQEISQSKDPLFLPAITEKILSLPQDKRDLLETILDGLSQGEEIIIENIEKPTA